MGALTAPPLIALCCRISFKTSLTHWIVVRPHFRNTGIYIYLFFNQAEGMA
jgi:hypothetical protein